MDRMLRERHTFESFCEVFMMKRLNRNCGPEWKGEGETERLQEMEGDGNSDECIQEWGVLKRGKNS